MIIKKYLAPNLLQTFISKVVIMREKSQFDPQMYTLSSSKYWTRERKTAEMGNASNSFSFGSQKESMGKKTASTRASMLKMEEESVQNGSKMESNSVGSDQKARRSGSNEKPMPTKQQTEAALKTLRIIKQWRGSNIAPVDTVGCERLHDESQEVKVQKYQTLVALMLSIQTRDEITGKVMYRLRQFGLNPEKMSKMKQEQLIELIKQSNFNKRKAKNIIEASKKILKDGLPSTMEELMQFSGIGTKIATIYMRCAQGQNAGIGVDTHVHRISNRLGWVKTKNPNETEESLQKLFPQGHWDGINIALVGFGQTICDAKKPKCARCPVSKLCPSYKNPLQF